MRTPSQRSGFTLVEIMVVVMIIGVILSAGIPALFRMSQKEGMRKAISDVMEACSHARAVAILQGVPMEFVLRAEDGSISVQRARMPQASRDNGINNEAGRSDSQPVSAKAHFTAQLPEDVAVRFLDVNFKDHMELPEARVRFFPNGTSDEFTIVLFSPYQGETKISLDMVTGLAESEAIR